MKTNNAADLKRNQVVTLCADRKTLNAMFKAGESFKFLGWQGTLARLSRINDNAKLITEPEAIGFSSGFERNTSPIAKSERKPIYDTPHSDQSGNSRKVVIASVLAGKHSGDLVMHFTPAEEREYNRGMAMLAEG